MLFRIIHQHLELHEFRLRLLRIECLCNFCTGGFELILGFIIFDCFQLLDGSVQFVLNFFHFVAFSHEVVIILLKKLAIGVLTEDTVETASAPFGRLHYNRRMKFVTQNF